MALGDNPGDTVRLRNVVLDASSSEGIHGPGDLIIDVSLVWRRGRMADAGTILLNTGAGNANKPVEGVNASIEAGTLEFGGRAFELNDDFFTTTLSAEDLKALLGALQGGSITFETYFNRLRSSAYS